MSFGSAMRNLGAVQEALVLALMLITVFALFYIDMNITYKIGIAVIAFAVVFLTTLAASILRQEKELRKAQQKA